MQQIIDAFEKAHPTIKVNYQSVPDSSINSTVDARVSNKSGSPDAYWADQPRVSALAARGEAEDLTQAFSQYKDAFTPALFNSAMYQGKLWALPMADSTQMLYYNKTLLAKANIEPPSSDPTKSATWDDIVANATKAKAAGAKYGLMLGQVNTYYQLQMLPMSMGGSTGLKGDDNLTPDILSDPWIKAMTWYGKLFADGVSPRGLTEDQYDADFAAGQTAYMVEGGWEMPMLDKAKFDWGVAPVPTFQGGKPVSANGSWMLAMNPFSKQKAATAVFMKWMTVESGYSTNLPGLYLAATAQGIADQHKRPSFQSAQGQDALKIINYEATHTAISRPSTVGYIEFETIMDKAFSDISNGQDAKTALTSASGQLKTALAKYQK